MKRPYVRSEMKTYQVPEETRHHFEADTTLCLDLYPAKRTPQGRA
jgi:hypothetical protein